MSLLRRDSKLTIVYQIEMWNGEIWHGPNYDHFGYPVQPDKHIDSFSASGVCWQDTGLHGTFDLPYAKQAMIEFGRKHNLRVRLVVRRLSQETIVLEEFNPVSARKETN